MGRPKVECGGLSNPSRDLPPIVALFVIYFDNKAGYTLGWRRSKAGVQLEGVVEYKSLPSGLHKLEQDLMLVKAFRIDRADVPSYFVHDEFAGVSSFINSPADEASRHALMLSVGVLVPLSYGRMGRCWRHAQNLTELARVVSGNNGDRGIDADVKELEGYWEEHQLRDNDKAAVTESPLDSPSSLRFKAGPRQPWNTNAGDSPRRSLSTGNLVTADERSLNSYHPALSLPDFLDTFGPLIFPLHRAALLRKRILLVTEAPVEKACNFVYDISIISNIPLSVNDLIDSSTTPRLRPLFAIGVHDIPLLERLAQRSNTVISTRPEEDESEDLGRGWVAVTTDEVLAGKEKLYDVLVRIPPAHSALATEKSWPRLEYPRGKEMKATQRDARRYLSLRRGLLARSNYDRSLQMDFSLDGGNDDGDEDEADDQTHLLPTSDATESDSDLSPVTVDERLVEPMSWPAVAYSSYLWWASAGERRTDREEEEAGDDALLEDVSGTESGYAPTGSIMASASASAPASAVTAPNGTGQRSTSDGMNVDAGGQGGHGGSTTTFTSAPPSSAGLPPEMIIIAYFHRLTTQMLSTVADVLELSDTASHDARGDLNPDSSDEDEDEDAGPSILITSDDMGRMGLDVWSAADQAFVRGLVRLYFARAAHVQGGTIECCGVRIC